MHEAVADRSVATSIAAITASETVTLLNINCFLASVRPRVEPRVRFFARQTRNAQCSTRTAELVRRTSGLLEKGSDVNSDGEGFSHIRVGEEMVAICCPLCFETYEKNPQSYPSLHRMRRAAAISGKKD